MCTAFTTRHGPPPTHSMCADKTAVGWRWRYARCARTPTLVMGPLAPDIVLVLPGMHASARSVAASYKPPMLVTRARLPACAPLTLARPFSALPPWDLGRRAHAFIAPTRVSLCNRVREDLAWLSRKGETRPSPLPPPLAGCGVVCQLSEFLPDASNRGALARNGVPFGFTPGITPST